MANLDKLLTAEEEVTLPGQVQAVIDISGVGQVDEVKVITGKAVVKGRIQVALTYRSQPGYQLETVEQAVPFNQIIDLDNAPEDAVAFAEAEMIGCTLTAAAGQEERPPSPSPPCSICAWCARWSATWWPTPSPPSTAPTSPTRRSPPSSWPKR